MLRILECKACETCTEESTDSTFVPHVSALRDLLGKQIAGDGGTATAM